MFNTTGVTKPDAELEARLRQSFGRLRDRTVGAPDAPGPERQEDATEIREPSLPAKLFLGPNATWYDDRWRWMDWRGRSRSWNWAAASTFGTWFGYRRMHGWLVAHGGTALVAWTLILLGVPLLLPLGLLIAVSAGAGLYGNYLYLGHFRRIAAGVAERYDQHDEQIEAIERAGGIEPRMVWLWPLVLTGAAASIAAIVHLAGVGPTVSL